eukprot:PhF_6_TR41758/c0_g1_i3/m.63371
MDGNIILWCWKTHSTPYRTIPCMAPVHNVIFMEEGAKLVSAGKDGAIRFWDVKTGANTIIIEDAHGEKKCTVFSVAISESEALMVSCSRSSQMKLWDLPLN